MLASQNPFFIGGPVPPEHFVGRKREIDSAFDLILKRGHLAVHGNAGMGKTSFLYYLNSPKAWQERELNPSEVLIVYLNCTDINPFTPPAFWQKVLSLLKNKAKGNASLQSEVDKILQKGTVVKDDLRLVLDEIGQQNKFLVLLMDDYDAALQANSNYTEVDMLVFLSEFRNLAVHSDEGRYLSTAVTSFRRLNELGPKVTPSGSPWYNHYVFRCLKPFTNPEVTALLSRMPMLTGELKEGILEIADGHPALLQNACYRLYETLQAGQASIAEQFARDFESDTEHFFHDAWEFSTEMDQMLLMLIALSHLEGRLNKKRQYKLDDIDIIFSQRDRELRDLEERGIIQRTIEQGPDVYSFASSLMEWWVIKEIENSKDEAELEQRQKVFLNLSRKQVEQIKKVMREVWEHKDAVKSIVGWIGKLVGTFAKGVTT